MCDMTVADMQQLEADAFARGETAHALMEEAGRGIAGVVRQFFHRPGHAVLFLGKGNNAGDALVAGRELLACGWKLSARLSCKPEEMKPLPLQHWQSIQTRTTLLAEGEPPHQVANEGPLVLLDGLLGIGAQGALRGPLRTLAQEMNALRLSHHATTIAMDLPSGLDGDTGVPCEDAVIADITATIAAVKQGLLADTATAHVGRLAVVPLPALRAPTSGLITDAMLRPLLPRRNFAMHKGQAGRVALIAGSRGYTGAAVLASLGALKGGAGLVTLLVQARDYDAIASRTPPEVMVRPLEDDWQIADNVDAVAIGPGLGFEHEAQVLRLIRDTPQPMVVDADALTLLARTPGITFKGPRLLTPHPGEMQRLIARHPAWQRLSRADLARAYVALSADTTLLLKGSRTVIASYGRPDLRWNSTGTPGMASGGMGDVLSGLCAALIAQGMALHDAASAGSWLIGRAAERCIAEGQASEASLSATDVAAFLGRAFVDGAQGCY